MKPQGIIEVIFVEGPNNETILLALFLILVAILFGFSLFLWTISKNSSTGLKQAWKTTELLKYKEFEFFLAKASAYRRIFTFFTFLSYTLKALGILATFFLIYSLIEITLISKTLLIISAMCDAVSLLFPFQKYIDSFSQCCILMEEAIFKGDIEITHSRGGNTKYKVHRNLQETYIKCENLLHVENKI